MSLWFILLNTKPRFEHTVFLTLHGMKPEIKEVHPLFGEWDLIAYVEMEDEESFEEFMKYKISEIEGIIGIKTLNGLKNSS